MTDRSRIGTSRTSSFLKSLLFVIAASVILDYLLPQTRLAPLLGGTVLAILAVLLFFGSRTGQGTGLQSFLLVSTVSVAVAIVVVEILFRVFLLRPAIPTNDQDFAEHIAAHWQAPVEPGSTAEGLRVVGLADSFGRAGEEDNFLYVAGRVLADSGTPNEVVNLSEWGLELRDELDLFKRYGPAFEPDIVLHSFFVGNDFDLPSEDLYFFGTVPMRYTPGLRPIRPRWFLHRRWLGNCLEARRNQRGAPEGGFSDAGFLAIERQRLRKWSSRDHLESVWPRVRAYLDQIRTEAQKAGAAYAIVIQPDQYQVDRDLRDRLAAWAGIEESEVQMRLPQSYLDEYCDSTAIPCLDLLPTLVDRAGREELYLVNDTHYNLKGNAIVGQEVARFVEAAMLFHGPASQ